jgi:hypothetical protein
MKRFTRIGLPTFVGVLGLWTIWVAFGHAQPTPISGLQVKFENDRVRVLELRLKPGQREKQHSHPQYVLYALTDYRVRNTKADGSTQIFDRKAGDVFWGESVTHSGENIGNTELRAVIVELKPARGVGGLTHIPDPWSIAANLADCEKWPGPGLLGQKRPVEHDYDGNAPGDHDEQCDHELSEQGPILSAQVRHGGALP